MNNAPLNQPEQLRKELFSSLTDRLDLLTAALFVVAYLLMLTEPAAVASGRVVLPFLGSY